MYRLAYPINNQTNKNTIKEIDKLKMLPRAEVRFFSPPFAVL